MKKAYKNILISILLLYFVLQFSIGTTEYFVYIQYTMFLVFIIYGIVDLLITKKNDEILNFRKKLIIYLFVFFIVLFIILFYHLKK
jgi:hypothetical protein